MTFVDLFAGLGGFHLALKRLGLRCTFANETDDTLRRLYQANFGVDPAGDIRQIPESDVPAHNVLCAGFPCQPFSKAGEQNGMACPRNGDLFGHVLRILEFRRPEFVLLENVPNLARHDGGRTWEELLAQLRSVGDGYDIRFTHLSPHQFGIPQVRDRLYIVGRRGLGTLDASVWPEPWACPSSRPPEGAGARKPNAPYGA